MHAERLLRASRHRAYPRGKPAIMSGALPGLARGFLGRWELGGILRLPPLDNNVILDRSIAGFGIAPADPTAAIVSGAGTIDKTAPSSRQSNLR